MSQRSRVEENTVRGEINMTLNYEEEGEVKLPVDCEGLAKEVILKQHLIMRNVLMRQR